MRFDVICVQVGGGHTEAEPAASVAIERFTRAEGLGAAAAIDARDRALTLTTDRSQYGLQVRSDSVPITTSGDYWLEFTMAIERGGMGVEILDEKSAVLGSKYWCQTRPERAAGVRFHAEGGSTLRIGFRNCGIYAPLVSRFSIKDVRIFRASPSR